MAINLTRNQIQTPSAPTVQQERQWNMIFKRIEIN